MVSEKNKPNRDSGGAFRDELGFRKDYPFKGISCTSFENICQAVWAHCSNNDNGHVCLATHKCGCNSASDCPVDENTHIQGICEDNTCKYAPNCGNVGGDTYLCASGYCCTYDLTGSKGECIEEGNTYTSNGESGICVN